MADDPLIGRQLANFRVDQVIGRGGMSQVYYGWDVKLQRPVAIKVIDARYRSNPSYAERFVKEAQSISKWRHENIVQIHYADEQNGLYYFVMEYIDGEDLGSLMRRVASQKQRLRYEEVIRIGSSVANALDYAHQRGVIHRDVKPSNVMVSSDGRIVLTDFGLAMDVEQGSMGEVVGSPHYTAPEQARRSSDATPQSDLYSLGVMLYEMLAGQVPFDDPSPASLALQHLTLKPPPPRKINPNLSEQTEAVLLKVLSKSPTERYQSGAALMEALQRALKKKEDLEATVIEVPPDPRPQQRRAKATKSISLPLLLGGVALAIILMLGAAVILLLPVMAAFSQAAATPTLMLSTTPVNDTAAVITPIEPIQLTEPPATTVPIIAPSNESAPTITDAPTEAPVLSATATILNPNGYRVVLFYADSAFYIWNPGDRSLDIASIVFEALDAAGQPTAYRYEGSLWAAYYPQLLAGGCDALTILGGGGDIARPTECAQINAARTPLDTSEWIFWQLRDGISQFRVLWANIETARCEIAAGTCEVYIP